MGDNLPSVVNWDQELIGARALIKSGLVPPSIKTAEAALFLILTGRDLGLSPVQRARWSCRQICSSDYSSAKAEHSNG
jgi:hypothetical protein